MLTVLASGFIICEPDKHRLPETYRQLYSKQDMLSGFISYPTTANQSVQRTGREIYMRIRCS